MTGGVNDPYVCSQDITFFQLSYVIISIRSKNRTLARRTQHQIGLDSQSDTNAAEKKLESFCIPNLRFCIRIKFDRGYYFQKGVHIDVDVTSNYFFGFFGQTFGHLVSPYLQSSGWLIKFDSEVRSHIISENTGKRGTWRPLVMC